MSDLKKDIEAIEAFLKSPSPLGRFAREKEPVYQFLKNDVEYTGKVLAKAQYVAAMREVEHRFAVAKLQAFVNGEELPKEVVEKIDADIKVFITDLKEGKYS